MKQIFPTNESKVTMASNNSPITQQQYCDLVNRVNEGIECSEEVSQKVEDLLKSQNNQICTNNLNANTANIDSICNNEINSSNGIFGNVTTSTFTSASIESEIGNIKCVISDKSQIGEVNSDNVITNNLSSTTADITSLTSESIETDSIKINGELGVNTLDVGSLSSDIITTPNLKAENATIENVEIEKERVQESEIESLNVGTADVTNLNSNYIIHELDPQEVNELGDVYILFPQFTNGFYMVEADNDTNKRLWSFELTNSIKNIQFRWSESELGQLVDVKFKEDAAGVSIVQVHINTNEHITLFRQSITTSNTLPPTIYVEDQLPDIDPPKLTITHQSGTYIQDVIFTNKLHIDCLEMDALFMDCVGIYRELWLTCDFNQAGDILEPIPTCGENGQYVRNTITCGVVHPTWESPAERVDSTCLNLTPSCVVANYDGTDYQGTFECEWFDQCPRYPIKHLNEVTCAHGVLNVRDTVQSTHGNFTYTLRSPHVTDAGGSACTNNRLVYNSATEREEAEVAKQFECIWVAGDFNLFVYPRAVGSFCNYQRFAGRNSNNYGYLFAYGFNTSINPYDTDYCASYTASVTDDGKYYIDLFPHKDTYHIWDDRASIDGLIYKDIGLTTCVEKVRVWTDAPAIQGTWESPYYNCTTCFQYFYSDGTCSECYAECTDGDVTNCYYRYKDVIEKDASRWVLRCGCDYVGEFNDNYVASLKKENVDWKESDNKPVIYEATSCTLKPTSDLKLDNLDVDCLNVNKDAVIGGDLYVKGTTHTVEEETISTGSDTIILRQNNNVGLANGDASGIIINKYNGTNNLALVTDCSGTLRVGEVDGESTTIENVYYKDGKYYSYDSETEEYTEIETSGELTAYDSKEIVDGYTHYTNAVFTVYNYENLSPVLGRDEITNMCDNALLKWNAATWEANTISVPTEDGSVLKYKAAEPLKRQILTFAGEYYEYKPTPDSWCSICCSFQKVDIDDSWLPTSLISETVIDSPRTDACNLEYTGCTVNRPYCCVPALVRYCAANNCYGFLYPHEGTIRIRWTGYTPGQLRACQDWSDPQTLQYCEYQKFVQGSYYWEKEAGIYCFPTMACYAAVCDDIPNNSLVLIENCENNLRAEI